MSFYNKSISYTISTITTSLYNALSIGSGLVAVIIMSTRDYGRFNINFFCAYHSTLDHSIIRLNNTLRIPKEHE